MEDAAEAVAAEFAYHGAAFAFGVRLNGVAEIAERGARLDGGDAAHHGFVRDVHQALRFARHVADAVHAARVAVPAINNDGDVDIDDVAATERPVAGDAVADGVIDRGANRVAVAAVEDA